MPPQRGGMFTETEQLRFFLSELSKMQALPQKSWPSRNEVSTTCVSRWVKANFNRNEGVFDPSAYADGTDSALHETLKAKPQRQNHFAQFAR